MASLTRLLRRSLENPSTPLSAPDDWLYDALGARRSSSGVRVNPQTALTYSAWWRGCDLISGGLAKLPLRVYRWQGKARQRATDHPAYKPLRHKANRDTKSFDWKKVLQVHALSLGNGYSYIARDGAGRPLELLQLNPTTTYPVRENGVLWYVVQPPKAELRKVPAADILHFKGLSWDGLVAYSVISKAREALGLGLAMEAYGSLFFGNGARPAVILEHPGRLSKRARANLRRTWEKIHAGLENAHRTAILEEGMRVRPFALSARDAQLLEERQMQIREIANFLGLPAHKLGDTSRAGYNSLEQENQSYLDDSLDPWLVGWEEECRDKLLTEQEKEDDEYTIEFDRRGLVRANLQARGSYYSTGLQNGWLCIDEVRGEEGLNPLPNNLGEKHYKQVNLAEIGAEDPPEEDPADPPADDKPKPDPTSTDPAEEDAP